VISTIIEKAKSIQFRLVDWRRHLHHFPELGCEVPKTAAFISSVLKDLGVAVKENVGGLGVVGLLEGSSPGKTVALRADIDAVSVPEETGVPYASKHPGVMHACGHDGHTAMLLGVAYILREMLDQIPGSIKLIFQPAEEGPGGARPMIADGVLENPKVDVIFGLHIGGLWDIPSGYIGVKKGPMMAGANRFVVNIHGKAGHAAMPHRTVDSICIASHVVSALQTIVSRNVNPLEPAVISIGSLRAGTGFNIVAENAEIKGTMRYFKEEVGQENRNRILRIASGIAESLGGNATVEFLPGYPPLINDDSVTAFFQRVVENLFGKDRVIEIIEPSLGADDMAYFLKEVPGTYFALGSVGKTEGVAYSHHHPKFNIDEDVLWMGSAALAAAAFEWLKENS
jgi:amidohydrolase